MVRVRCGLGLCALRFMGREHLQNSDVNRGHEPIAIPLNRPPGTFSPTGGEGRDEGARFMESLLSLLRTHWDHEPLRLTEARSGPRVCDPQPARFMERPPRTLIAPCALEPGSWAGCFRDGGTKYPPSFGGGFTCSPR